MGYKRKTSTAGTGIQQSKGPVLAAEGAARNFTTNAGYKHDAKVVGAGTGNMGVGGGGSTKPIPTSQGSGISAGHSRMRKGKNRLGSGNPGAMRG